LSQNAFMSIYRIIILAVVLILIYFALGHRNLSSMTVNAQEIEENQETSLNALNEQSSEEDLLTEEILYDLNAITSISANDVAFAQARSAIGISNNLQTGAIWIPDIGIALGIYKGFYGDNQYLGACTYYDPATSNERFMGRGNYVLVGHNSVRPYQLFSPLKNARAGMKVYLSDYKSVYIYEVESKDVVSENRTDLVDDIRDGERAIATLQTCYGGGGTKKRTVVRCNYIEKKRIEDCDESIRNMFS